MEACRSPSHDQSFIHNVIFDVFYTWVTCYGQLNDVGVVHSSLARPFLIENFELREIHFMYAIVVSKCRTDTTYT